MAYNSFTTGDKIPDHVNKFLSDYRARARIVDRQASYEPTRFNFNSIDYRDIGHYQTKVYYQNVIEISMAEEDLKKLIEEVGEVKDLQRQYGPNIMPFIENAHALARQNDYEYHVRKNNPGVQLAWEKYQMMLKIAGGG